MFYMDDDGNIILRQGDSGTIVIQDIDTTSDWRVYFGIYDEDRNNIGEEMVVNTNYASSVYLDVTAELTDLLTVPDDEESATYYYGIKLCNDAGVEDTLIIGDGDVDSETEITVYPRKVLGD